MRHPNAFTLLAQIAYRAKWNNSHSRIDLKPGEALIGDYASLGLTEQKYRTAKNWLKRCGFATFTATNKGTVATLTPGAIWALAQNERQRPEERASNEQDNDQKNGQTTTNKDKDTVETGETGRPPKPPRGSSSKLQNHDKAIKGAEIPLILQTPEFMLLWSDYCEERRQPGKYMTPRAVKQTLDKLLDAGLESACEALQAAIAGGWKGVFPQKRDQDWKPKEDVLTAAMERYKNRRKYRENDPQDV